MNALKEILKLVDNLSLEEKAKLKYKLTQLIRIDNIRSGQYRGHKGTKMVNAIKAVPDVPTLAVPFCLEHDIALTSIIQKERNKTKIRIHVRKPYHHGPQYIWRGDKNLLKDMLNEGHDL